ncbi:flagellar biosynthesis protein FliQ [Neobacillus sp. 3P2-tot-E-2]|jgi:flagellar biosynthesis protein FliQ|uniref:flagellar biosynthesis protein FliQ n=1 Tax=Neobacillus TaxID=2675232 RepID=UPI0005EEE1EE|nr:flagellar biosynthesis protein FliQ [Neobacillus niacini]MDF2787974.1 flagellar biosynthetic protein FliQ [Neobacillus sp.]MDR7080056.1 flagellar biosynthetic protein FliQ [Neobacillus niacini]
MTPDSIMGLAQSSIYLTILVLAPVLGVALAVGLIISIFQAITQIQEQTLAFAPKIIAVFVSLLFFGPWMLTHLVDYTRNILSNLTRFIG